jgi:hypothetical protein
MTVETKLRTAMAEAVSPTAPDADRLVIAARRRGLGIRRRRQALSAVGVAAALALAVAAPLTIAGNHGGRPDQMSVGTQPATFDVHDTSPLTGRSAAAALVYAVGLVADGEGTDFRGAADAGDHTEAYTIFRFTPAGSATAGEVAINVQPDWVGDATKPGDKPHTGGCESFMTRCTSTRLADGSRLTTYDDLSGHTPGGIRRVAELYRPADDVRVIASATNGDDVTELDETITRADPVLTTGQLVAVVTQPWWGPELPTYFTAKGAALSPYSDRSASAIATPTTSPTS